MLYAINLKSPTNEHNLFRSKEIPQVIAYQEGGENLPIIKHEAALGFISFTNNTKGFVIKLASALILTVCLAGMTF